MKPTLACAAIVALAAIMMASSAQPAVLFTEDFEAASGMADGKWATVGSAYTSANGYNSIKCMQFSAKGSGGDSWTIYITVTGNKTYWLSMDYKQTGQGGFAGMNEYNGSSTDLGETWIFGDNTYATIDKFNGPGIGWNHYVQAITTKAATVKLKLKFEDFTGNANPVGKVYFDNIKLSDTPATIVTTVTNWREVVR